MGNYEASHKGVDVLIEGIKRFLAQFDDLQNINVNFNFCGSGSLESDCTSLNLP